MATDDLAAFLHACSDEEERLAYAAVHARLGIDIGPDGEALSNDPDVQDHLATWHPARVLREVEAKRGLLAMHAAEPGQHPDFCWHDKHKLPCPTLRLLAAVYADRPGYRPEWAPDA